MAAGFTRLLLPMLALLPVAAQALSFNIGNGSPQIYLRVGATGGTVSTVQFNLTGSESTLGNGTLSRWSPT